MAALHTLLHSHVIRKTGVLVLNGYGIRVQVNAGHLLAHDGIADERRTLRLPRVASGLRRLICIGSDGFITLDALRWVSAIRASFLMLDKRGKVITVCSPTAPSDVRLRRSQSLALTNGTALRISKELIRQKIEGQAALVCDMLNDPKAAETISKFAADLPSAESIESVRLIESQAARTYWSAWAGVPVRWPMKDERRIPELWKRFGSRISPLTGSPRLAANPPNALANLLYGLTEAEARIAAAAMGLDADIGMLHVDTPNRSSLACDLQEPIRPKVDAFILNWLQTEQLRKTDFWEDRQGNCRICSPLVIKLCETADTWRRLVAPVAEYVAQELWSSIPRPSVRGLATRLTQRTKRKVKGSDVPEVKELRPQHVCTGCGKIITAPATIAALRTDSYPPVSDIGKNPALFTTPLKRLGYSGWDPTGCAAQGEGTLTHDAQHSSDGFWTVDVRLTQFSITGIQAPQTRYMRIEIEPNVLANAYVGKNPLKSGEQVLFGGPVVFDNDPPRFLEVHPIDVFVRSAEVPPQIMAVLKRTEPPWPRKYVVIKGDCLAWIAERNYGAQTSWPLIYANNRRRIKDPDLIYAGREIVLPPPSPAQRPPTLTARRR